MKRLHPDRIAGQFQLGPQHPVSGLRPLLLVDALVEPVERSAVETSQLVDWSIPVEPSSEPAVADSALGATPALPETEDSKLQLLVRRHKALPKYVQQRSVKGGTAYYWCKPSWARDAGCPIPNRPLGRNLERTRAIASSLNDRFHDWREARSKRPETL
jgi:hypothetical protein